MILSCNSCEKKFVVPDNAITASGRLVQCSSCGNKWKQFPIKNVLLKNDQTSNIKISPQKTIKTTKIKKQKTKKRQVQIYIHLSIYRKNMGLRLMKQHKLNKKIMTIKSKLILVFIIF